MEADINYNIKSRKHYINIEQFGDLINLVLPVNISTNGVKGLAYKTMCEKYMFDGEILDIDAFGDQLMHAGFRPYHQFIGTAYNEKISYIGDFGSKVYYISKVSDKKDGSDENQ